VANAWGERWIATHIPQKREEGKRKKKKRGRKRGRKGGEYGEKLLYASEAQISDEVTNE